MYVCICMYVCACACACECARACVRVRVCVRARVCMYLFMYIKDVCVYVYKLEISGYYKYKNLYNLVVYSLSVSGK